MTTATCEPAAAKASWSLIRPDEIARYMPDGHDFIPDGEIQSLLDRTRPPDAAQVRDLMAKSLAIETLTPAETAALLRVEDPELLREMAATALEVKRRVYDNRIVTFAPLYMSNLCVNNCLYCGFRGGNTTTRRRRLDMDEVRRETEVLAGKIGHKRLIVVYGEHPTTSTDYIAQTIDTVYAVKAPTRRGFGQIRRVNVNAAPLPVADLKVLHQAGIGTFQVFQETYHRGTYATVHPSGVKADYRWRLYCMHRAMEAGVDDVGLGALFGLYDWRFEVMGLLYHARELEAKFGIGPHTISFPRLEPAHGSELSQHVAHPVSDEHFKRLIVVLRLAVPYTGMIVTARESRPIRDEAMRIEVCTQTDASTRIGIGAYSDLYTRQEADRQQFMLGDTRSLEELVCDLARRGMITSFCTAGYRSGRTGGCIMEMLKNGKEARFCKLNAVLTFREWLEDFASPEAIQVCEPVLNAEIEEIRQKAPKWFDEFYRNYQRIVNGERDIYF